MSSFISSGKVSKLFMMLSCLPLPPLPVKFTIRVEEVQDANTRQALSVAMNSLEGHGRDDTKVHSSHAILAALTMFADWCEFGKQNAQPSKIVKDGLVLKLMKACLEAGNGEESCSVSEEKAYDIFFDITRDWILCCIPADAKCKIEPESPQQPGHESVLHVAMSHYCYSQGVLYSAKGGRLCCPTHSFVQQTYESKLSAVADDPNAVEAKEIDDASIRMQQQEMAEIYSKYSYAKLLALCFCRIHRDSLLGHMAPGETTSGDVLQTAKTLLEEAIITHSKVLKEKNIPEVHNNLQLVQAAPQEVLDLTEMNLGGAPPNDGDTPTDAYSMVERFITLTAHCMSDHMSVESWISLAKNIEDWKDLTRSANMHFKRACQVIDIDKLKEILAPIVSNNDVSNAGMKRTDQVLIEITQQSTAEEHPSVAQFSYASELGILIRFISEDPDDRLSHVRQLANDVHRATDNQNVKVAAEVFGILGITQAHQDSSKIEVID